VRNLQRRQSERGAALLEVRDLSKHYGGVQAVEALTLSLAAGEIIGLIGPNGAGKTTVFNLVTGLDRSDRGRVFFAGEEITRRPAHRIARLGLARTFQNLRLLEHLSVLDNVKIAYHKHVGYTLAGAVFRLGRFRRDEREIARRCREYLDRFDLGALAAEPAGSLPYGRRRNLEIARALACEGELLLLDEPAAGLNPAETAELAGRIRAIRDELGVTILLIEHDMRMVMSLCERIFVLDHGRLIASGPPEEIKDDPAVVEAYLGRPRRREEAGDAP
jgi:branched-chain amino acid transport system ATP-binding protein